jgi:hypothetical protein
MNTISKTSKKIKLFDLERPEFEDRPIPGPGQPVYEAELWVQFANDTGFRELVEDISAKYQVHHISEELPGRLPATVRLLEPFMDLHSDALNMAQHFLWRMAENFGMRWASFRHPLYGLLVFFSYPARCRFWANMILIPDLLRPFRKRQAAA